MKQQNEPTQNYVPDHAHSIHYLHFGNTALYKPYTDNRGIHCAGDRFGYIVDWQIPEKKGENNTAYNASH